MLSAIVVSIMLKNPHAIALGRLGGLARARALKSRRRVEIARKAAQTRWAARGPDYPRAARPQEMPAAKVGKNPATRM